MGDLSWKDGAEFDARNFKAGEVPVAAKEKKGRELDAACNPNKVEMIGRSKCCMRASINDQEGTVAMGDRIDKSYSNMDCAAGREEGNDCVPTTPINSDLCCNAANKIEKGRQTTADPAGIRPASQVCGTIIPISAAPKVVERSYVAPIIGGPCKAKTGLGVGQCCQKIGGEDRGIIRMGPIPSIVKGASTKTTRWCQTCVYETMDTYYLIDDSGSVRNDFATLKTWLAGFWHNVIPTNSPIAAMLYDADVHPQLGDTWNVFAEKAEYEAAINGLTFFGGITNTKKAVQVALAKFEERAEAAPTHGRVMLIFTDGGANDDPCGADKTEIQDKIRELGINVIIVGVGTGFTPAAAQTVECLVSDPKYIITANFDSLDGINAQAKDLFCSAPAPAAGAGDDRVGE